MNESHTRKELRQLHDRASDNNPNTKALGQRILETFNVGKVEVFDD